MMTKYKSSKSKENNKKIREEYLKESFKLSLEKLKKKCKYFDTGDEDIAIDMAVQLRVLLYSNKYKKGKFKGQFSSKSLLTMLGLDDIEFLDTSCDGWKNSPFSNCIFGENFSGHDVRSFEYPKYAFLTKYIDKNINVTFKPNDKLFCKNIPLNEWLKDPICYIKPDIKLSRYDIILILCNKDGGAHYEKDDLYIIEDEDYKKYSFLKKTDSLNFIIDGKEISSSNIPLYTIVRQIAFEVIKTLEPHCERLCN